MRTYLSVPFAEKEEAKQYGARWDPDKKLWYSPDARRELIDRWPLQKIEPIVALSGEDRSYGGNTLFVDLIPRSCWFTNVRKCIDFSDWERLRHYIYERANNQCECCSSKTQLDAHERWSFDEEKKVQKLMRIIALCKPCHEATHMGLAQIKGRGDIAQKHLIDVTGMSHSEAINHIEKSFKLWGKRSLLQWELDLTLITKSGIKLAREFTPIERTSVAEDETTHIRSNEIIIDSITKTIGHINSTKLKENNAVKIAGLNIKSENIDLLHEIQTQKNKGILSRIIHFFYRFK